VLGGSSVATVQLAHALADWPGGDERRPPLEFALHGRNEAKLTAVTTCFARVAEHRARVWSSLDLERVLAGADVVLVQVRVGGLAARSFDESFPWLAGLPGEETLGPGGFANALRTVQALEQTWPHLRRVCPEAIVVILTNPAGIVRQAAARHGLRAVEVCDSPITFVDSVAARLGRRAADVGRRYCGMNHVGWYTPEGASELEALASDQALGTDVVLAHRAVPLGYLRYYLDQDRIFDAQQGRPTRAEQLMEIEAAALRRLAAGETPDAYERPAPWYRLGIVPTLDGLANGSETLMILGCANTGRIATLPNEATIEGPTRLPGRGRIEPLEVVPLPAIPSALLYRHATYEQLAIEAAAWPDRTRILAALLANPMVATARQAEALTEVLLQPSDGPKPA
jgi:6-phospho-beta-glucosidase